MEVCVFTIKGMYARFRIPHTTSSALTFMCIHPIAVKGLIGAVMGVEYNDIFSFGEKLSIGIQILKPVNFDTQSVKVVSLKGSAGNTFNFPSNIQFLRDVKYRIFVKGDDSIVNELSENIKEKKSVFTPYLGVSEYVAKLDFEGKLELGIALDTNIVHSIIPKQYWDCSEQKDFHVFEERIPTKSSKEREYIEYQKVVFSDETELMCSNDINKDEINAFKVGEYGVYFF